jgi:hypothetical protein
MASQPDNADEAYKKQAYEIYIKERDTLRSESLELSGRYDQATIALAGGALALSLTFIEKIAPHPRLDTLIVLVLAWACLIGSVLCQLFALVGSQTAVNRKIRDLTRRYQVEIGEGAAGDGSAEQKDEDGYFTRGPSVQQLNLTSRWLLAFGLALLCFFSFLNLSLSTERKTTMTDETNSIASEGSFVPPDTVLFPPRPAKPAKDN